MTLVNISRYNKTKSYSYAKTAGSLSTATLIFTIIAAIPLGLFLIGVLFVAPEMFEDTRGDFEEIIYVVISMIMLMAIPVAIIIFGFSTSAKGRSLFKSVTAFGDPDYIPIGQRNAASTYSYSGASAFTNASGQDIRNNQQQNNTTPSHIPSSFVNASGSDIKASQTSDIRKTVQNNQTASANKPIVTESPKNSCDYGRSETGYIPHAENEDTHCAVHNTETSKKSKWKCPSCGKRNRADETFCRNCGTNRTAVF